MFQAIELSYIQVVASSCSAAYDCETHSSRFKLLSRISISLSGRKIISSFLKMDSALWRTDGLTVLLLRISSITHKTPCTSILISDATRRRFASPVNRIQSEICSARTSAKQSFKESLGFCLKYLLARETDSPERFTVCKPCFLRLFFSAEAMLRSSSLKMISGI